MSDERKTCGNCGNTFRGYGNVCPQCGAPVSVEQPKPITYNFSCPHCGQRISAEPNQSGQGGSCPTCNQPIIVPEFDIAPPPADYDRLRAKEDTSEAKANARTGRIILTCVAVFIVLIVWFMFSGGQSSSDYHSAETDTLAKEGQRITREMEEANRNHDFSHVDEINRRRNDFMQRSRDVLQRRAENGDENARKTLDKTKNDRAFK